MKKRESSINKFLTNKISNLKQNFGKGNATEELDNKEFNVR